MPTFNEKVRHAPTAAKPKVSLLDSLLLTEFPALIARSHDEKKVLLDKLEAHTEAHEVLLRDQARIKRIREDIEE